MTYFLFAYPKSCGRNTNVCTWAIVECKDENEARQEAYELCVDFLNENNLLSCCYNRIDYLMDHNYANWEDDMWEAYNEVLNRVFLPREIKYEAWAIKDKYLEELEDADAKNLMTPQEMIARYCK